MPADALAALAVRFGLAAPACDRLLGLVELLTRDALAPTSVRDPRRVVEDHIADSLVALELEAVRRATKVADIGSGAGLPGLPLAIAVPEARFTLLESSHRKVDFLSRAIRVTGLVNAEAVAERVETWEDGLDSCDLVTARAVAALDVVAEYAAPLLKIGGTLVVWRGRRDPEAEHRADRAAALLGLRVCPPTQVHPYPEVRQRHLHMMVKVSETPPRFPRRPGAAAKRPLGGGVPRSV